MKLPAIQYNTGVQSFGRYDTSLPVRTAGATTKALMETLDVAQDWAKAEDAKNVAENVQEFNQRTEKLFQQLDQSATIDLNEHKGVDLDIAENEIQTVQDENGKEHRYVPKHLAITPLFDHYMGELREEFSERRMSRKGQAEFDLRTGETTHRANLGVAKSEFDSHRSYLSAAYDKTYQDYIYAGDERGAQAAADAALATGVWGIEKHNETLMKLGNDIDSAKVKSWLQSDDPATIERAGLMAHDPNLRLTPDQRITFYLTAQSKSLERQKFLLSEKERIEKENSVKQFEGLFQNMLASDVPMSNPALAKASKGMRKEEMTAIYSFNNTLRTENDKQATEGDSEAYAEATMAVTGLAYPSEIPMAERRKAVMDTLARLSGTDPQTMKTTGPSRLGSKQYKELIKMVNDMSKQTMENPDLKFMQDHIYQVITGAAKGAVALGGKEGLRVAAAARADKDMYLAARDAGPGFDPFKWWDENQSNYLDETSLKSIATSREIPFSRIIKAHTDTNGITNTEKAASELYQFAKNEEERAIAKKLLDDAIRNSEIARKKITKSQ